MNEKLYFLASKDTNIASVIIKWWQFGFPYTHIAILHPYFEPNFNNPYVIEMLPKGLHIGKFYDVRKRKVEFDIFFVKTTADKYERFVSALIEVIKKKPKYDWLGILGFVTRNKNLEQKDRFFCSELAFYLCQKAGIELLKNTHPSEVSPRLFLKSPLLEKVK